MTFARRSECQRALLFHHDPAHDDRRLEAVAARAAALWDAAGATGSIELAREGQAIELAG